jgi:hypothetical protein
MTPEQRKHLEDRKTFLEAKLEKLPKDDILAIRRQQHFIKEIDEELKNNPVDAQAPSADQVTGGTRQRRG